MSGKNYKIEFTIYYHQVNCHEQATPLTMLHYLEDTAIAHSEAVGQGLEQLKAKKQAWILNQWQLQMDRYPLVGERVIIETWSVGFERFYGSRDFLIRDSEERIIGRATSLWIFYNTERKRPLRIPPEFAKAYGVNPERAIAASDQEFAEGSLLEAREQSFSVRRSDIDTNGHVNNVNYLEWMLEAVPEEVYGKHCLGALEIVYKKAAAYGAGIDSKCAALHTGEGNIICRHTILKNGDLEELALAKTVWVPLKQPH